MLILAIITGIISLVFGILWVASWVRERDIFKSNPWYFWAFAIVGFIWFVAFCFSLKLNLGANKYTGYIYSSDTKFGYVTGHIRFSEQAGQDVQPSFCVKADSETGKKIIELAGSGEKVIVDEPPFFYFANNPFACGTDKTTITPAQPIDKDKEGNDDE